MSGLLPMNAGATAVQTVIPTRFVRLGTQEQPANHCGVQQALDELFGMNLDEFRDPDGTLTTLSRLLHDRIIPEVSSQVVRRLGMPYDWCRHIHFVDGPGTARIVLPFRNLAWVNVCFLRVLPSMPWYRFVRFRNTDGTEFARIGGVEPPQDAPENIPPNFMGASITAADQFKTVQYTGIEDADLHVDTQRHMIVIPPRVLIAGVAFPIWSYTFLPAPLNVETHFTFGFAPTRYENNNPLSYQTNGHVNLLDPTAVPTDPMAQIDWASGMPVGLSVAVARLVCNRVLRRKWRILSNGLASMSVDGASESYSSGPFSGDLEKEDEHLINSIIGSFGEPMVI